MDETKNIKVSFYEIKTHITEKMLITLIFNIGLWIQSPNCFDKNVKICFSLRRIQQSNSFNKNLLCVAFKGYFNQPIDLPKNVLKILIMCNSIFKQSIIFPKKIVYVEISCERVCFTLEHGDTIKYFYFGDSTMNILDSLPNGLGHILIGVSRSSLYNNLPNTMTNVRLPTGYNILVKQCVDQLFEQNIVLYNLKICLYEGQSVFTHSEFV